jgi:hypothetical protein
MYEPGSEEHIKHVHQLTRNHDWNMLNECDELSMALSKKDCLVGFTTPQCEFPPTFKVHRQTGYTYNEKRSPSYTDRILHKANHLMSSRIETLAYGPIDNFTSSDHKPIRGAYSVQLNDPLKWRPVLVYNSKSFRWNIGKVGKKVIGSKSPDLGLVRGENLHLFCSGIECEITSDKYGGASPFDVDTNPSPFVSFISTPTSAMSMVSQRSGWKRLLSFWKATKDASTNAADATHFKKGWPCTSIAVNKRRAQWDEEVHFKIRTHDNTGTPLNLTGALLHVLIHDAKDSSRVIGSCTLNLAFLIKISKMDSNKGDESSSTTVPSAGNRSKSIAMTFATRLMGKLDITSKSKKSRRSSEAMSSAVASRDAELTRLLRKSNDSPDDFKLKSVREAHRVSETIDEHKSLHPPTTCTTTSHLTQHCNRNDNDEDEAKSEADHITSLCSPEESVSSDFIRSGPSDAAMSAFRYMERTSSAARIEDIHCLRIDEAVTKNGKEVGRVKLKIDTWWLNERVSNGEGLENRRKMPGQRAAIGLQ